MTWNFKGVLKKEHAEIPGPSKKEVHFPGMIKKQLCRFFIDLGFLVLEFLKGVAQFCRISRGESLFSKDKVTNL